jgi:rfaE bifunctional protein nucleotidyltransferase chain/domain
MGKIVAEWDRLQKTLDKARQRGKRIVTTNGVFDVLHIGHVRYLQQARALGDLLVVGVNTDRCTRHLKGPLRPFVPENERAELLAALNCVDYVTYFDETTPEKLLDLLKPDIHAKGGDYHLELMPETATVRKNGGTVVAVPFVEGYSTTSLAERIADVMNNRT